MSEVLVSACLMGRPCRYDGESMASRAVLAEVVRIRARGDRVIAVCPEELGGLATPRPAAELRGGDGDAFWSGDAVIARVADDEDISEAFERGAHLAAESAPDAVRAILKARSPSCGCHHTHIDGRVQMGRGVFAALLHGRGIQLQSDEDL